MLLNAFSYSLVFKWIGLLQNLSSISDCMFSLDILTAIFPGGPGLAGTRISPFWILLEQKMMEVVVTNGAIRRSSPSTNQHLVTVLLILFLHLLFV